MPTKPIERLMFAQGGACFFCGKPLTKAEASVEHLVATANGGKDNDENCVVCCTVLNRLFGHMSLKEKLKIVLNQKGHFVCPSGPVTTQKSTIVSVFKPSSKAPRDYADLFLLVVTDLQKRGNARPGTVEKLQNTIKSYLVQIGESGNQANSLLQKLTANKFVTIIDAKVTYTLPPKGA